MVITGTSAIRALITTKKYMVLIEAHKRYDVQFQLFLDYIGDDAPGPGNIN